MTTSAPSPAADAVRYDLTDGIVTLTIDDPNQSVNTMNATYIEAFEAAVNRLAEEIAPVLQVDDAVAADILARRATRKFTGIEDLAKVPGVDAAKLRLLKARLMF